MNLHFEHIHFAYLAGGILVFIALFIFLIKWKRKVTKRIGDPHLVRQLIDGFSSRLFNLRFGLFSVAFGLGVLSVMNLRKAGGAEGITRKGIDVVIALDVSRSMLATDIEPSRLDRAKQLVSKLMSSMPDNRFAMVVFAGKAYLQMPLTTDQGAANLYLSSLTTDAVPQQGTVISEALQRSADVFDVSERRFKSVILISDGEDHDEEAIRLSKDLAEQGVMISTVGIGSPDGAYIPDPVTGGNKKDETGSQVISKLNEQELQELAANTNGVYVRLEDSDDAVSTLKRQLAQIDTKALGDISLVNFKSYYWLFAAGMLLLLMLEYFIPEKRRVKA